MNLWKSIKSGHAENGKDITKMALLFKCLYRHKSEKQKLADALINSSNSWVGINDYSFKHARAFTRNIKKARRPSDFQNNSLLKNSSRRIISQMECIGTEVNGGLATYGEIGDDYDTARDFVIAQAFLMNNLKKFTERLGYYQGQPRSHQSYEDMLEDFSEWWSEPDSEEWYDLAANYFDGHELTEKEKGVL